MAAKSKPLAGTAKAPHGASKAKARSKDPSGSPVGLNSTRPQKSSGISADEVMSLTLLAELTGESGRGIQRICEEGFIPRPEGKGNYNVRATIKGMIAYFRSKASGKSETLAQDKAEEQRANTEIAQINAAKAKGQVVLRRDVKAIWDDGLAQIAVIIRSNRKISTEQKKELFGDIMKIELEPLPENEE